ncbi:MAG: NHL repeat-containing protein [Atribacterota bacterium]
MKVVRSRKKTVLAVLVVYLCFFLSGSVQAVEFPWKLEKSFEEVAEDPPFMNYPVGVVVDSGTGVVWVSDWGNNRVLAFTREGKLLKSIPGLQGPVGLALRSGKLFVVEQKGNQVKIFDTVTGNVVVSLKPEKSSFREPRGIWVDGEGNIYVADTGNSRIVIFDSSGKEIDSLGKEGMGDGEFYYPRGITVDREGHIWIVDTAHNCVQVLDKSGRFLFRFGREGSEDVNFRHPRYIFVQNDFVFISDYRNHRITIYDRQGNLVTTIGGKEGIGELDFSYPEGVWVDEEGILWVADAGNNRVKAINAVFLLQPKRYLLSLLESGNDGDFFALWERLSPEERKDPELARLVFRFLQKRGDLEGMIAQAEELFLNDAEHRDRWRKTLGELYYLKGKELRKIGKAESAREFYLRSFRNGYWRAFLSFLWLSFLLMGGSNVFLLVLALVLLLLLLVFYRIKMYRKRWSKW